MAQPSAASPFAIALPMPSAPPVTAATRSFRLSSILIALRLLSSLPYSAGADAALARLSTVMSRLCASVMAETEIALTALTSST